MLGCSVTSAMLCIVAHAIIVYCCNIGAVSSFIHADTSIRLRRRGPAKAQCCKYERDIRPQQSLQPQHQAYTDENLDDTQPSIAPQTSAVIYMTLRSATA